MGESASESIGPPSPSPEDMAKAEGRLVRYDVHAPEMPAEEPQDLNAIAQIFWNGSGDLPGTFTEVNGKVERSTTTLKAKAPFIVPQGMHAQFLLQEKNRTEQQKVSFNGKNYEKADITRAFTGNQFEEVLLMDELSGKYVSLLPSRHTTECNLVSEEAHSKCGALIENISPEQLRELKGKEANEILVELDKVERLFLQVLGQ